MSESLAITCAAIGGGAVAVGFALACPGAALAIAPCLRIVFPVRQGTKDQPANGYAPGKVVNGGPVIEGGQCFPRKGPQLGMIQL